MGEEFSLTIEKDVSKKANIGVVEDINRGLNGEKMFHLFVNDLKLTGHFHARRYLSSSSICLKCCSHPEYESRVHFKI